jgi:hypothetical protein
MIKRDCPPLPLLVHRKTTTLASTTFSEPRRGRPYSKPQSSNPTVLGTSYAPDSSICPQSSRASGDILGGNGAVPYRYAGAYVGAVVRLAVTLKP